MSVNQREQFSLDLSQGTPKISPRQENPNKPKSPGLQMLAYAGHIGISILVPLLVGIYFGRQLDDQRGTHPTFVLIGLGLGFLLSLVSLLVTVKEILKKIQ